MTPSADRLTPDAPPGWVALGASVIGRSHLLTATPCQDAHHRAWLNDHWGLAIVCDGAGSAQAAECGSRLITSRLGPHCSRRLLAGRPWFRSGQLPDERAWRSMSVELVMRIRRRLIRFAHIHDLAPTALHSTLILLLYSRNGALLVHVGDGRAAVRDHVGEWSAAMRPFRGEEAGTTVFVTSPITRRIDEVIESRVIPGPLTGFALMSDGVENAAFLCSRMDAHSNRWSDPNLPHSPVLEPLWQQVAWNSDDPARLAHNDFRLARFLLNGNRALRTEQDDRTLVLGVMPAAMRAQGPAIEAERCI